MNRNLPWICLGLGALKFVPNAKVKLVGNSQGNPPEHGIPNLKLPMTFHFMLKKLWIESPSHCCCSFLLALSMLYIRSWLHLIAVVQGNHIHGLIRTYYPSTCKCSDQIKIIHHLWKAKKKTWIKIHPSLIFHLGGGGIVTQEIQQSVPTSWEMDAHETQRSVFEAERHVKKTFYTMSWPNLKSSLALSMKKTFDDRGPVFLVNRCLHESNASQVHIYIYTNLISCKN